MKKTTFLYFCLLLINFFATSTAYSQQKWITVYTDNFGGNYYELGPGQYDNTYLAESGISMIGSVKVPEGMRVTLFSEDNFRGRRLVLTEDATTQFLTSKGFTDPMITVSIFVDLRPKDDPQSQIPVITIYQDNFSGASKNLSVGRYEFADFGQIANDQLSSIKIPKGLQVTLYEHIGYEGRTLTLLKDTPASFLVEKNFNDLTSSILVEEFVEPAPVVVTLPEPPVVETPVETKVVSPAIKPVVKVPVVKPTQAVPVVTLYQGDFNGLSYTLDPGRYGADKLGIGNDELSSLKIAPGFRVTLYESDSFEGRSLVLTQDAHTALLTLNNFNNAASSLIVERIEDKTPAVTIYEDNFSGESKNLSPGSYDYQKLGLADKTLSSIAIPRGLQVRLFDQPGFAGRLMTVRGDTDKDFLIQNNCNDRTTSLIVEQLPANDLVVTLYSETDYKGVSQTLAPGRYTTRDLTIGNDQLSSVRVPAHMQITLFENDNFTGGTSSIGRDMAALSTAMVNFNFNNAASSVIVDDLPVRQVDLEYVKKEAVAKPVELPIAVAAPVVETPPCNMAPKEYEAAVAAIKAKSFRNEKMTVGKLATKNKCLTNEQIRGLAKAFVFEDQMLEFVKYAHDLASEKSTYYSLDNLFKFISSKDSFSKFLSSK